jgi:hypothetical protein
MTPEEIARHPGVKQLQTVSNARVIPATNYRLLANSTSFDIHAASAGIVCLTECQAANFDATANDLPETVFTVNRAFKGLYLERPGDYHIEFVYRPRYWRMSCALFWIACMGIAAILVGGAVSNNAAKSDSLSDAGKA